MIRSIKKSLRNHGLIQTIQRGLNLLLGKRVFIRTYESPEWLKYFSIESGDVVIDAGANVGIFTQIASSRVGEEGLVIAVEPAQSNLATIKDHLASASNTEIVGLALMDFNGTDKIQIDPEDMGAASLVTDLANRGTNIIEQRTEVVTLDALVKKTWCEESGSLEN